MSRMPLLLGTTNKGKIIEMQEALRAVPLHFHTPDALSLDLSFEERGGSFAENAQAKAFHFHHQSHLPTVADDSGLLVEALAGELGLHTRRWGVGPEASDEEWIEHFLKRMATEENRRARFLCTLCYVDAEGKPLIFEGECAGMITETLEADYLPGLPISACFRPDGFDRVYSALTIEQKNSTSHRGKALQKLKNHLLKTLL